MKKKYRKIAKKAGFVFWKDEPWGPGRHEIDWGSCYGGVMDEFIRLLIKRSKKKK